MSDFNKAKYYLLWVKFSEHLTSGQRRRVSDNLLCRDWDAPTPAYIYADGIDGFEWRKPLLSRGELEQALWIGVPFSYAMIPSGRDHDDKGPYGECSLCGETGTLKWGQFCCPLVNDNDWVEVDPRAV